MVPQEKAASDEGAKDQNADAVEPVEEPPRRVAPKEEPREENFTFVGVVDPIVVQVEDSDVAEDIPTRRRRARSSSRNSALSSSNMSSPEIIQRSPTLKRKTGSSASNGIEAKRRMVCDQASTVTPDLGRTKTPASAEVPASVEVPGSAEVPASAEVTASAEIPSFPRDNRINGDEVIKANGVDERAVTSTPKPARKIDPRVLQLKQLQVLLVRGSVFKCTICGRILVKSTLSDANRHCLREHSVNIVQYFKMASGMSDGELSIINISLQSNL